MFNGILCNKTFQAVLQAASTGNNDSETNCPVSVEAMEVFSVAVKEWVFVIPLDFQGNSAALKSLDVVYIMGRGIGYIVIDTLFDIEVCLGPAAISQIVAQPLGDLRLPAAAANDLRDWKVGFADYLV